MRTFREGEKISNIYDSPSLYDSIFPFRAELGGLVDRCISENLTLPLEHALDPACGPGDWLRYLPAKKKSGVDLSLPMIQYAQGKTKEPIQFYHGDMRDIGGLGISEVDLAINLEGTIGHLGDECQVGMHLKSIRSVMRQGGLYILGCPLDPAQVGVKDGVDYFIDTGFDLDRGTAFRVRYNISNEKYALFVDSGADEILFDPLHICFYRADSIERQVLQARFQIGKVYYMAFPGYPSSRKLHNLGDVTLALVAV